MVDSEIAGVLPWVSLRPNEAVQADRRPYARLRLLAGWAHQWSSARFGRSVKGITEVDYLTWRSLVNRW